MAKVSLTKNIGRIKIKSSYSPTGNLEKDKQLVIKMIDETIGTHNDNKKDIEIIKKFHDNHNTIEKTKEMRSDINNVVEVPEVYRITRDLNGHICGSGVVFSDMSGKKSEEIAKLNSYLKNSFFSTVYLKANKNASLYGVGYYYIEPNNGDEINSPFLLESENLDPLKTYCVYNQGVIPKKIWAVIVDEYIDEQKLKKQRYIVFSKNYQFIIEQENNGLQVKDAYQLAFNSIPIVEIQRNEDRIGDSELALSLIQAKNRLFSNRIDDVEQVVDYVYLLYNLRITKEDATEEERKESLKTVLSSRVIELETINPQIQPKVDILKNPLNQSEIQTLASYIDSEINIMVALPDRNSDSSGNSDTGVANDYKLGFRSLDTYSDNVSAFIVKSLNELLNIMFKITNNIPKYSKKLKRLSVEDIEIKPQRNKIFSITDAANAYSTLRGAGLNDEDSLKVTNISQDVAETANKNKKEAEELRKINIENQKELNKINNSNNDGNNNSKEV